jgi:hypothetical protein
LPVHIDPIIVKKMTGLPSPSPQSPLPPGEGKAFVGMAGGKERAFLFGRHQKWEKITIGPKIAST